MTAFWLTGWAFVVAAGWLLPNHQPPWSSFHVDAWIAAALALASIAVTLRSDKPIVWHSTPLMIAALGLVPAMQYALGLVLLSGTAWISSAYIVGLLLALLTGAQWEASRPGQLADGLFLAIGTAAVLSVGLQLHQWLGLDLLNAWSMGDGNGRPFANFGQPNQLATFLLWGLLAVAWGLLRRRISRGTATLLSLYLLFGLALTQSRTAWIALGLLILASWYWHRLWADRRWPWLACALGLYFAGCALSLGFLNQALLLSLPLDTGHLAQTTGETRPLIWSIFIDAALQRPLFGYGWNQVGMAHISSALSHPALESLHAHSHNLFLDLVLWCGIPAGLLLSLYLVRWFWLRIKVVDCAQDAVLMLLLLVIGNHAMLELPLHYAYFLLPVGLVMGALNVRLRAHPVLSTARWSLVVLCGLSVALLALIIRDYLRIEKSHQELRFEQAHIRLDHPGQPPDVLLLTQFREFIRMARFEPTIDMSADDLDWMRRLANTYPGTATIPKLALALAMNGQGSEAQLWLRKVCRFEPASNCNAVCNYWTNQSLMHPALAAVPWPNELLLPHRAVNVHSRDNPVEVSSPKGREIYEP